MSALNDPDKWAVIGQEVMRVEIIGALRTGSVGPPQHGFVVSQIGSVTGACYAVAQWNIFDTEREALESLMKRLKDDEHFSKHRLATARESMRGVAKRLAELGQPTLFDGQSEQEPQ